MATKDGVDVGVLGVLRGAKPSAHQQLTKTLLGVAVGSLAIDYGVADERILLDCRAACEHVELSLSAPYDELPAAFRGNGFHEDLAYKVIRLCVKERPPVEPAAFLAIVGAMLQQIRAAVADTEAVNGYLAAAERLAKVPVPGGD